MSSQLFVDHSDFRKARRALLVTSFFLFLASHIEIQDGKIEFLKIILQFSSLEIFLYSLFISMYFLFNYILHIGEYLDENYGKIYLRNLEFQAPYIKSEVKQYIKEKVEEDLSNFIHELKGSMRQRKSFPNKDVFNYADREQEVLTQANVTDHEEKTKHLDKLYKLYVENFDKKLNASDLLFNERINSSTNTSKNLIILRDVYPPIFIYILSLSNLIIDYIA